MGIIEDADEQVKSLARSCKDLELFLRVVQTPIWTSADADKAKAKEVYMSLRETIISEAQKLPII